MDEVEVTVGGKRRYHHGALRRVLLDEAIQAIAESGPAAVSLRDVARRAGVSHAAPAHHFRDKGGLLTAVAAEGFRMLAATLSDVYDATGSFLEVGVAYVRFAMEHPPYFEVMFRPELYHMSDPELREASAAAEEALYGPLRALAQSNPSLDPSSAGIAAWSLVHGLATLCINGSLPPAVCDNAEDAARSAASYLFQSVSVPTQPDAG